MYYESCKFFTFTKLIYVKIVFILATHVLWINHALALLNALQVVFKCNGQQDQLNSTFTLLPIVVCEMSDQVQPIELSDFFEVNDYFGVPKKIQTSFTPGSFSEAKFLVSFLNGLVLS